MATKKQKRPWDRVHGEGTKAHELFMIYVSLGAIDRTLAKTAEASGRSMGLCAELSSRFSWPSRATAYDDWMVDIQQKAVQAQLQKEGIQFAQKRSVFRTLEHSLATKLLQQAQEMADTPLFQDTVTQTITVNTVAHPEGEAIPVQIVRQPVKWTKRDALAYAKIGIEIMRLHLEMETSRMNINVDMSDPNVRLEHARAVLTKWRKDVDALVDEQLSVNPSLDRQLVKVAILQQLPEWAARDWKLTPEQVPLLTEGDEAIPLNLEDISM